MRNAIVIALLTLPGLASAGTIEGVVKAPERGEHPVIVYVEQAPRSVTPPAVTAERLRIGQKNTTFTPPAAVVVKGTPVDFPNFDKIYHNVFSLSPGNEFDLGLYRGGVSKSATLEDTGEVDVYCNIHPDMHARVLVVPNAWHVSAGPDGSYKLEGLPSGTYKIAAWSPAHEIERKEVKVGDGTAKADFSLKTRRFPQTPHLNKHGEQYGRYR